MIHKFELGTIEYKLPNIIEGIEFIDALSVKEGEENRSYMQHMAKIIARLGSVITKVNVTFKGKKISSYKDLLECRGTAITAALLSISNEINEAMFLNEEKKS